MKDKKITVDGVELIPVGQVLYAYRGLENPQIEEQMEAVK